MTDKQIIIDGVDVADCEHLNACYKKMKCVILQDDVCEIDPYCEGYNCNYKQYKRKEQECGELKKERDSWHYQWEKRYEICESLSDNIDELRKQLDQLKAENDKLKEELNKKYIREDIKTKTNPYRDKRNCRRKSKC